LNIFITKYSEIFCFCCHHTI